MNEFCKYVPFFTSESDKPILIEAFVSDSDESEAYLKLINANKEKKTMDSVKSVLKEILGQSTYEKIKHTFK